MSCVLLVPSSELEGRVLAHAATKGGASGLESAAIGEVRASGEQLLFAERNLWK